MQVNKEKLQALKQGVKQTTGRGRFRNTYTSRHRRSLSQALKNAKYTSRYKNQQVVVAPDFSTEKPCLTWLGHATYLIQQEDLCVITDPVFSKRCSPSQLIGPKRYTPFPSEWQDVPTVDIVLISHNHYDHLDTNSILFLAKRDAPRFFVPSGVKAWFDTRGIDNVVELSWWQTYEEMKFSVYCLPVQHFSGRGAHDRNKTQWCAWRWHFNSRSFFFAGDTGYSQDFNDIRAVFPVVDFAFLPIGAYAPEDIFAPVHCTPEEAVQIHVDVNSQQSFAMHWGTFALTLEPADEPPQRLVAELKRRGMSDTQFQVLKHGETVRLNAD